MHGLNKLFFTAFVILTLAAFSSSVFAYIDQSFSVYVKVLPDGNARITEKSTFFLENQAEQDAFDYFLHQGQTTLLDWKRFSKNIGYHFSGGVSNLHIVAAREYNIHPNAASVTLEYDAQNVMKMEKVSSRATKYTLNTLLIALISSKGEISLGNGMSFTIELPADSEEITVSPDPGASREKNIVTWTGPIFGRWDVEFMREESLSDEVNAFFSQSVRDLQQNYLWILLGLFAIVVIFKFLQKEEKD